MISGEKHVSFQIFIIQTWLHFMEMYQMDGAGGTLATVTEFMANGSLRNVLIKKDRSLDRRKKLIIAMDAAFGMEYLYSNNIVHFDMKYDNLFVCMCDPQRPVCKVGDFGLSRIKRNTLVSVGVRGTLPWIAATELLNRSTTIVSEKLKIIPTYFQLFVYYSILLLLLSITSLYCTFTFFLHCRIHEGNINIY